MCLSLEALVLFINLLPAQIVETAPDRITIHSTSGPAVWQAQGDLWCTQTRAVEAAFRRQGD